MIDLWILALGFGVLPLLAVFLFALPDALRRHEAAVWGLLIGVVAFLGLAHAGTAILEGNTYLRFETNPFTSGLVAAAGLLGGIALGWRLLGDRTGSAAPATSVVWAATVFVALHSVTDGLVLGEAYAGPLAIGFTVDAAAVAGTVLHRFAEGALLVAPALLAAWKPRKTMPLLLVGLATLPAAYIPVVLWSPGIFSPASVALDQAIAVFAAGLEAGFALLLLLIGLLPRVRESKDLQWAVWAGIGFTLLLLVHFLVE